MSVPASAPALNAKSDAVPDALSVLNSVFGLPAFRGEQGEIIRHVTAGGNCLVADAHRRRQVAVLSIAVAVAPRLRHRGLAADRTDARPGRRIARAGVKAAVLNSTLSWDEASAVEARLLAGDLDLLYVAPERLVTPRCLAMLAARRSPCLRSTRRIACRNGGTTFARNISACR